MTNLQPILSVVALLLLSGCGGGGGGGGGGAVAAPTPNPGGVEGGGASQPTVTFRDATSSLGLNYDVVADPNDPQDSNEQTVQSGGLALDDIDNDGNLELYVTPGSIKKGRLFTFVDGRFVELPGNKGIAPKEMERAGYFVDLDADGWKDFVSIQYESVEVFRNDGTGSFVEATAASGIAHQRFTFSMAAADYDLDGDLDLF